MLPKIYGYKFVDAEKFQRGICIKIINEIKKLETIQPVLIYCSNDDSLKTCYRNLTNSYNPLDLAMLDNVSSNERQLEQSFSNGKISLLGIKLFSICFFLNFFNSF